MFHSEPAAALNRFGVRRFHLNKNALRHPGMGHEDMARSHRRGAIVAAESNEAASNFTPRDNTHPGLHQPSGLLPVRLEKKSLSNKLTLRRRDFSSARSTPEIPASPFPCMSKSD
jgi:hypothetical protein